MNDQIDRGSSVRFYFISAARWWWLIVVAALLLGALGFSSSALSPYKAEVLLRINTDSTDSTRVTQLAQTSVRLVDSSSVYSNAAATLGADPDDLRNRTVVGWLSSTELISVVVEGPTAADAERAAEAMADAAIVEVRGLAATQLNDAQAGTDRVLSAGTLRDRDAEQARRQAIGTATADRQNGALASSVLLTRIGEVKPAVHSGVSPLVGVLAGVLSGIAIGLLFAFSKGRRVGRVRGPKDLEIIFHRARILSASETPEIVTAALAGPKRAIGIMFAGNAPEQGWSLARDISYEMNAEGISTAIIDGTEKGGNRLQGESGRSNGSHSAVPATGSRLSEDGVFKILVDRFEARSVARLRGRADNLVIHVPTDGSQSLSALNAVDFPGQVYLVHGVPAQVSDGDSGRPGSAASAARPDLDAGRRPSKRSSDLDGGAVTDTLSEAGLRQTASAEPASPRAVRSTRRVDERGR